MAPEIVLVAPEREPVEIHCVLVGFV
jgi:hypothetical protein